MLLLKMGTKVIDNKNKWDTDLCYNMDNPWKYHTYTEKLVTKDHMLYNSIYMKCPEWVGVNWQSKGKGGGIREDSPHSN